MSYRYFVSKPVLFSPENSKSDGKVCHILDREQFPSGLYYFDYEDQNGGVLCVYPTSDRELERKFYDMEFTDVDFLNSLNFNSDMFKEKSTIKHVGASMNCDEKVFLFNFIQKIKPKKIIEYSCHKGHSTTIISRALMDCGIVPDFFETHEIDENFAKEAERTLFDYDVDFVNIKVGDVFDTLDRNKLAQADFVLVDSDHSGEFADRYVKEFFPLIKKDCWIAVHDMRFHPQYVTGETEVIEKYIKDINCKSYFYLADLLKILKMTLKNSRFEHVNRNTLLFFKK